jgi:hypothetical protein
MSNQSSHAADALIGIGIGGPLNPSDGRKDLPGIRLP